MKRKEYCKTQLLVVISPCLIPTKDMVRLPKAVSKKEGPKKISRCKVSGVFFSQLPVVKNDTENCATGNVFGPSYFVTTLVSYFYSNSGFL